MEGHDGTNTAFGVGAATLRTGYENGLLTIRLAREGYDLQRQPAGPELVAGA